MVRAVFGGFCIESGEKGFGEVELAHIGGLQLGAQALREGRNACEIGFWTAIRNNVFSSRGDRGDSVEKFLVQARRIHTLNWYVVSGSYWFVSLLLRCFVSLEAGCPCY